MTGTGHKIRRGVTLYSFQEEFFTGKMTLEDEIAAAASIGANGIEIIPQQTFSSYPFVTDKEIAEWHDLHAKYGTVPTAVDSFADLKKHKDRLLTIDEVVEDVLVDIKLAQRLGAKIVRIQMNTPTEAFERLAPYAIEYGQKLGMEVHSPLHYEHRWVKAFIDVIERVDNGHLGLIGDMSTFVWRFPRVLREYALRNGATPANVDYIVKAYENHPTQDPQTFMAEVLWRGGTDRDITMAGGAAWQNYIDPQTLIPHIPYLFHFHAKFWEMQEDNTEYSIPYADVIPVLMANGYEGYLSSEYEGNRFVQDIEDVDSVEQLRRQHTMLAELLGENE